MFFPNRWIKPRLKSFCVAYGVADVTLVLLSAIGWIFFFEISFQAQQDHLLLEYRSKGGKFTVPSTDESVIKNPAPSLFLYPYKEDRKEDEIRLQRTVRACGLAHDGTQNEIDHNSASPGALVGASMGGYAILGALLASLNILKNPSGKRIICKICLVGECLCTLLLFVSICTLIGSEALCPTEYFYENFQPIYHTFAFALIFITSYKAYEITLILFYFLEQGKQARKEMKTNEALRRSVELQLPRHIRRSTVEAETEYRPPSRKSAGPEDLPPIQTTTEDYTILKESDNPPRPITPITAETADILQEYTKTVENKDENHADKQV